MAGTLAERLAKLVREEVRRFVAGHLFVMERAETEVKMDIPDDK